MRQLHTPPVFDLLLPLANSLSLLYPLATRSWAQVHNQTSLKCQRKVWGSWAPYTAGDCVLEATRVVLGRWVVTVFEGLDQAMTETYKGTADKKAPPQAGRAL